VYNVLQLSLLVVTDQVRLCKWNDPCKRGMTCEVRKQLTKLQVVLYHENYHAGETIESDVPRRNIKSPLFKKTLPATSPYMDLQVVVSSQ